MKAARAVKKEAGLPMDAPKRLPGETPEQFLVRLKAWDITTKLRLARNDEKRRVRDGATKRYTM